MMVQPGLRIRASLDRGDFALNVDLDLPANGVTVLFGPSGSGKTTVLRCVAGLEEASGLVSLRGEVWQDSVCGVFKPTWQREIGYVFQEASLFEHLDVRQNLLFGLRRTNSPADPRGLDAALELLGIRHLLARTVSSLSGGERQRVAIARALAARPTLLLLDEPLASIDIARRAEVLPWLARLRRELQTPMLYVTHSVDELSRLADHLVMLDRGGVAFCGPLSEAMLSRDVAVAIGDEAGAVFDCEISERSDEEQVVFARFGGGCLRLHNSGLGSAGRVRIRILARDVSLARSRHHDTTIVNRLAGTIESTDADMHPSQALVRIRCGKDLLLSRVSHQALRTLSLKAGDSVWCEISAVAVIG